MAETTTHSDRGVIAGRDKARETKRGVARWLIKNCLAVLIVGAAVFLAAGRLDWLWGWAFVALMGVNVVVLAAVLFPANPELLAERSGLKEGTKRWDLVLAPLMAYGPVYTAVVAGLDFRWGWSPTLPLGLQWGALAVVVVGWALATWAMAANKFFAATVRIQTDRGHTVAEGGPYRFVRHPGYVGGGAVVIALAVMLGSLWALVPAAVGLAAVIARTALEDRTLGRELDGYKAYAKRTRYRLVPGVW
jgi:protein-S-isoprenylcysteine O-methyltransferase Ste14